MRLARNYYSSHKGGLITESPEFNRRSPLGNANWGYGKLCAESSGVNEREIEIGMNKKKNLY